MKGDWSIQTGDEEAVIIRKLHRIKEKKERVLYVSSKAKVKVHIFNKTAMPRDNIGFRKALAWRSFSVSVYQEDWKTLQQKVHRVCRINSTTLLPNWLINF